MSMRFHILFVIASIFLSNCAPYLHIIERYPNNKEKTVELMRGKGSSGQIIKRIEYYSNGRKKSEVDINNARKDGKYLAYTKNAAISIKGRYEDGSQSGKWYWYNTAGELDSIHTYQNGRLHGKSTIYSNGNILIKRKYSKGKLNGRFFELYTSGEKKVNGYYVNNLPDRKWLWWDENQTKARQVHFNNGVKHGEIRIWNEGIIKLTGAFDQDQKSGTWKWYHTKKQLDSLVTYEKGLLHGILNVWHKNGILAVTGDFVHGKMNGQWKWISEDEIPDSSKTYSNGQLNGLSEFYYNNGELKQSAQYHAHQLHGEQRFYFPTGQIKSITNFESGKKTGPYETWLISGSPEEFGIYKEDKLHGKVQRWYTTGIMSSIANYKRGILHGLMQIQSLSDELNKQMFFDQGNEIVRFEYHSNGRFKRVMILDNGQILYERKWNGLGIENTEEKYIVGTSRDTDFYLSGFLKYECTFNNDKKHGVEWWFDEDRKPTIVNIFYQGDRILSYDLTSNDERSE